MDFLERFAHALAAPITRLLSADQQTFWVSYVGAALVAAGYYAWCRRGKRRSMRGLYRFLFPRKLMRHPSTRLDIKFYLFGSILMALPPVFILGSMPAVSDVFYGFFIRIFGPAAPAHHVPLISALAIPLLLFLTYEFGYWLAHYAMHRTPILWEFHKAHHSAEVMTPLTEWRQHPVEYLLFPAVTLPCMSLVYAAVRYLYGPDPQLLHYWSLNLIFFAFILTLVHLRHSHLKMSAPGPLVYLIQTPAHHHIHHSTNPKHFDKNLGYCLAIWDWIFGTLYLPEKHQKITFGIGDHAHATSYRLSEHLIAPFKESKKLLRAKRQTK